MLPNGFQLRSDFPGGEQAKVTLAVQEISNKFLEAKFPVDFRIVHDYIFTRLQIVPYTDEIKEAEYIRRWKLTADDLLQVGTIVDGKYCNDVVNLFLAITKGIGFDAKLAKVFKQGNGENITVHSLAIIHSLTHDSDYLINIGSKDNYWLKELPVNSRLQFGSELPEGWYVWRIAEDQWAMGLNDSSQEDSTIVADARHFLRTIK